VNCNQFIFFRNYNEERVKVNAGNTPKHVMRIELKFFREFAFNRYVT
jgi:hypothetical protein